MQQPEASIDGADKLFDAGGKLANEATHKFLHAVLLGWIESNVKT